MDTRICCFSYVAVLILCVLSTTTTEAQLFDPSVEYGADDGTTSVVIGDLDGDGRPDLAVANWVSDNVSVLLGNGDETFQVAVNYEVGISPQSIAIGDLDGDSYLDLTVANVDSDNVSVLLGNGDGTFQAAVNYGVGNDPRSVAIGDLDGDSNPDLAVANNYFSNDVSVLLGNGDGTFQTAVNYGVGSYPISVAIGDLDGDSYLDLAVANTQSDNASVLLGNGDGTFQAAVNYGVGDLPQSVALGDLDGDSYLDLTVANFVSNNVSVLLGNGDRSFQAAVNYVVGSNPFSVAIGDLDGDSYPDLTVANGGSDNVSVLLGNGDGSFQAAVNYVAGDVPSSVALGDLDGDSHLDLAVANVVSDDVSVLINTSILVRLVIGPGPADTNSPLVRVFPAVQDASHLYEFSAYGASQYGVNVSCGDVTGDGYDQILTGAGPGAIYGPHVRGFAADGTPMSGLNFLAYGTNKYGVNVAAGDIDADGYDEIITGAGPGAVFGPHVRGWNYDAGDSVSTIGGVSYFAYGTPKWGVNVTCGDIDGDGYEEIVTGAGPGAVYGPHVRGWNVDGGTASAMPGVSFLAYGTNKFGVNVSCGDIDGDGMDEIITGAGPGAVFGAHVRGWNYDGATLTALAGINFFAWPPEEVRYGAKVFAGADLDNDGRTDLVVGQGPDPSAATPVQVYRFDGVQLIQWFDLEAFSGLTHGTTVAAGRF